jgi:hypothetical protein
MNGWAHEDVVKIIKDPGGLERIAVYQKHENRQQKKRPQEIVLRYFRMEFRHVIKC